MDSPHRKQTLLQCVDDTALHNLGVFVAKALALDEGALIRIRARQMTAPDVPATAASPASTNEPTANDPAANEPAADSTVNESAATSPAANKSDSDSTATAAQTLSHVWAKTPFGPLGCRTIAVSAHPDDAVLTAKDLLAALKASSATASAAAPSSTTAHSPAESASASAAGPTVQAPPSVPASWPGFLPVAKGWEVVEYVPAEAFRRLEKQARLVAQQNSGPLGLPTSLLDQTVIDIEDRNVKITMRDVFALCGMGFIPAVPDAKEPVRISAKGRWHRLDGRFGSIYTLAGFSVLPMG